jgi:hypothetical protein
MSKMNLKQIGWGVMGEPLDGVVVAGRIDVTGYHAPDYWDGETFLGPDALGIVPIYETSDGGQVPAGAQVFPHVG